MIPEPASTVYDLGAHLLEVTSARTLLLTARPIDNGPVSELVQLDREEAYNLLIALQAVFLSATE